MLAGRALGYSAGLAAGLVWGLAFVLPVLLTDWTAVTVTVGRYLAYGILSVLLFLLAAGAERRMVRRHWKPALAFAVTGNVGYYLLLVLGIEWVGAPLVSIIIGTIPVTLAVAGNLLTPSYSWRQLTGPILLVLSGMLIVNGIELAAAEESSQPTSLAVKAAGVAASLLAVVLWTWYGLANAAFLRRHPEVSNTGWSTVVGLGTGVITLAALPVAALAGQLDGPDGGGNVLHLIGASVVLGVLVSWAATVLWNIASARLSSTAAGMLINVETLAGFGYVYLALGRWPPAGQVLGFVLILAGVAIIVRLRAAAPDPIIPATSAKDGGDPGR